MTLKELLFSALASPLGIIVKTSDPKALKAKLYVERRKTPAFASLSFLTSRRDPTGELWIVHAQETRQEPGQENLDPAL